MGKSWDKALPDKKVWAECLRVLKPGAFAFVMSIPRADCLSRMIISLEDAGFKVNFTPIFWAYASGFPKAQNIGKAVDKRLGAEREVTGQGKSHVSGEGLDNNWGSGYKIDYNKTNKPATPQAKALDGSYAGWQPKPAVEVIIVAMKPLSEKTYVDQALKNGHGISWLDEGRIPYESNDDKTVTHFYPNEDAMGAMKGNPVKGKMQSTFPSGRFPANLLVSDDVLNDGRQIKGCHNNPTAKGIFGSELQVTYREGSYDSGSFSRYFDLDKWWEERIKQLPSSVQKTFPFLICPKASKSEKNKGCEGLPQMRSSSRSEQVLLRSNFISIEQIMDVGDYIKQAMGKEGMTADELNEAFGYVAGCDWWLSKNPNNVRVINPADYQKLKGILKLDNRFDDLLLSNLYTEPKSIVDIASKKSHNNHPTVKPLKLMSYLITLGSREGDLVLDPFLGSGTTALACISTKRNYIGCELDTGYYNIITKRISDAQTKLI